MTCSAHGSGGASGGAHEELPPREQSLRWGSLSVCWVAGFELDLYRPASCLFPDGNEQGWAFATLELREVFLQCLQPFSGPLSHSGYLLNLLRTFRLPICWVSRSPLESKGYCYSCSLNCKWTLACLLSPLSSLGTKGWKLRYHYECGGSFYFRVVISFPASVLKRWVFEEIQTMENLFKLPILPLPESGDWGQDESRCGCGSCDGEGNVCASLTPSRTAPRPGPALPSIPN